MVAQIRYVKRDTVRDIPLSPYSDGDRISVDLTAPFFVPPRPIASAANVQHPEMRGRLDELITGLVRSGIDVVDIAVDI